MNRNFSARRSGPKWTSSRLPQVGRARGHLVDHRVVMLFSGQSGTGKTTLAVSLSAHLSRAIPVTFVDADPRGVGSRWLREGREVRPDLIVLYSPGPRTIPEVFAMAEGFTIVDAPPNSDELNRELMEHADFVLIPTGTSKADLASARAAVEFVRESGHPGLLILSRSSSQRREEGEEAREALSELGMPIAQTEIRWHSAHRQAAGQRLTVDDLSPRNHAFREIRGLTSELISLLGRGTESPSAAENSRQIGGVG